MKVLWITNVFLPDILQTLKLPMAVSGSWLASSVNGIQNEYNDISIGFVAPAPLQKMHKGECHGIKYYTIPVNFLKWSNNEQKQFWLGILMDFNPDIVHIHGSEYQYGLTYLRNFPSSNVVLSIQGMMCALSRYSLIDIKYSDIFKNLTVHEILTLTMIKMKSCFIRRSQIEKEYFEKLHYVIGRTCWDYVHALTLNPNINYFICNETLRPSFYLHQWNINRCNKHTIFFSQSTVPWKGFHLFLLALNIVKSKYSDVVVRVAGPNLIMQKGFFSAIKRSTYATYILRLIKKYQLSSNIQFTGVLSEQNIVNEYLGANVFVCSSSIENSSNSICEAQMLGVPCVCSYVGGTPSLVEDGVTGFLYRYEEYEMLAYQICRIFGDDNLCKKLSEQSKVVAAERHSRHLNAQRTMDIYKFILKENL